MRKSILNGLLPYHLQKNIPFYDGDNNWILISRHNTLEMAKEIALKMSLEDDEAKYRVVTIIEKVEWESNGD